jgi:hypothetical protein
MQYCHALCRSFDGFFGFLRAVTRERERERERKRERELYC